MHITNGQNPVIRYCIEPGCNSEAVTHHAATPRCMTHISRAWASDKTPPPTNPDDSRTAWLEVWKSPNTLIRYRIETGCDQETFNIPPAPARCMTHISRAWISNQLPAPQDPTLLRAAWLEIWGTPHHNSNNPPQPTATKD